MYSPLLLPRNNIVKAASMLPQRTMEGCEQTMGLFAIFCKTRRLGLPAFGV
jgi:hypothetical protein